MRHRFIHFIALFLLMLVTGVFWGTWFTLTRSLEGFNTGEFIHIGKTIIANVAIPMAIIMPACILFIILSLWLSRKNKTAFYWGLASFILVVITLFITLMVLVPMDNQIKNWTVAPEDFEIIRDRWKEFHAFRTYTSLAAFACFSLFILFSRPPKAIHEHGTHQ